MPVTVVTDMGQDMLSGNKERQETGIGDKYKLFCTVKKN